MCGQVGKEGSGEDFERTGDWVLLVLHLFGKSCLLDKRCLYALTIEGFEFIVEGVEDVEGLVGGRHDNGLRL